MEDELRSFVGGMDLANDVAGDSERVEQAIQDTLTETATDVLMGELTDAAGIKTSDGRLTPTGLSQNGVMSETAQEVFTNNGLLSPVAEYVESTAGKFIDKVQSLLGG